MFLRKSFLILTIAASLAICQMAVAQVYTPGMPTPGTANTPGSPGYVAPRSYGMNKAMLGAGIGAAAAGGVLFYALRHRGVYEGCVSPDGAMLTRGSDGKRFSLHGQSLQPGEHVSFKAKKMDSDSTGSSLEVENVRKDFGPCEAKEANIEHSQHR